MVCRRGSAWSVAAILAAAAALSPASAQVVGKAATVNPDATKAGQLLTIGASVIHDERIVTSAAGSTQLLFIDQTTLSIGPNSELTIDDYVFDTQRGVGKMTVSLGKGVMRFIGGQITHNGSATVKTPPATIGIRGGIADIRTDGQSTSASNAFGTLTITDRSGPAVNVPQGSTGTGSGSGVPSVAPTTQEQASSNNQALQSKGTQTGGASPSTSEAAARTSTQYSGSTASITTDSSPASGSTAAGPSSTSTASGSPSTSGAPTSTASILNPDSASSIFAGGLPPQMAGSKDVQTSAENARMCLAKAPGC
jgi:hypothetical protein